MTVLMDHSAFPSCQISREAQPRSSRAGALWPKEEAQTQAQPRSRLSPTERGPLEKGNTFEEVDSKAGLVDGAVGHKLHPQSVGSALDVIRLIVTAIPSNQIACLRVAIPNLEVVISTAVVTLNLGGWQTKARSVCITAPGMEQATRQSGKPGGGDRGQDDCHLWAVSVSCLTPSTPRLGCQGERLEEWRHSTGCPNPGGATCVSSVFERVLSRGDLVSGLGRGPRTRGQSLRLSSPLPLLGPVHPPHLPQPRKGSQLASIGILPWRLRPTLAPAPTAAGLRAPRSTLYGTQSAEWA